MNFDRVIFQRDADVAEAPVRNYGYTEGDINETPQPLAETPVVETPAPAAEVKPVETAVVDTPAVTPVVTPATETPATAPIEIKVADWKEAIKTADKYEALKELGLSDFDIEMFKYKEQVGDYIPYLQVKTVDYTAMTPEQVLKLDLQKANPGMSDKALNFKLNKELNEKYYLDRESYPEDSDEAIYGQEQLRLDSEAKRKQFIEEQAKFKAPELKPDTSKQEQEQLTAQRQEKQKEVVINNPVTKALQTAKAISFGQGEESFTYPLENVEPIIGNALNTILSSDRADVSEAELTTFYQALAIGSNIPKFLEEYGKHMQSVGKKKFQSEIQNITPVNTGVIEPPKETKDYGYKTR